MRSQLESEVFLGPDNLPHHISGVHERVSGTYQAVSVDTRDDAYTQRMSTLFDSANGTRVQAGA